MSSDFLSGMTVNCLGDSTTWGDNGTGSGGPAISWTSHLAVLTGAARVRNYGVKGSRIGMKGDRDDSFIERYAAMEPDADAVLLFGGVNDFCREVPLGQPGSDDPYTFYGALDALVRGIVRMMPEARLVLMTPCKTSGVVAKGLPSSFETNGLGLVQADYVRAMRDVADRYALPVIDLYAQSGISPFLPEHHERYMPDGLHCSPAGYARLAHRIAAALRAVL